MRGSLMTGIAAACGLAMTLACGPGNVAPDDDARGDDDAFTDDDAGGDDDAATGGTGTISVTVEVLAVLAEGQSVEAEIVVDGVPTGLYPPAEIEAPAGNHTVTLKANEPDAPVPERFVAAPHEVTVARDGTVACPMFLGRDLGGIWSWVEKCGGPPSSSDSFMVTMDLREEGPINPDALPCSSAVWAIGWAAYANVLCLLNEDRVWWELPDPEYPIRVDGNILDNGSRMEYTLTRWDAAQGECPNGSYVAVRQE